MYNTNCLSHLAQHASAFGHTSEMQSAQYAVMQLLPNCIVPSAANMKELMDSEGINWKITLQEKKK